MTTVDNIDILSAGAAPLIAAYCREIKIDQIVNDMLRWIVYQLPFTIIPATSEANSISRYPHQGTLLVTVG